jgi:hypothetical protein
MNMIPSRETAYVALFQKLEALGIFRTVTRKLKHWADTPVEDQPALYMAQNGEVKNIVRGQPTRTVLEVELYIYVYTEGGEVGPILNPLLDAVETCLEPKNDGDHAQTLGGLVHHCWLEGQVQIFEGNLGTEAVAIVPVKILVT